MSYLHCPTCQRAYNVAVQPACPFCPVPATAVDPTEDIVVAAERLASAVARASAAERGAAVARMERLALPGPDAPPTPFPGEVLRSIRDALDPQPVVTPPPRPLLATIAMAVLTRLESRPRLHRALMSVRARVRALAA